MSDHDAHRWEDDGGPPPAESKARQVASLLHRALVLRDPAAIAELEARRKADAAALQVAQRLATGLEPLGVPFTTGPGVERLPSGDEYGRMISGG